MLDKSAYLDFIILKFIYGFNNLWIVSFERFWCNFMFIDC